MRKNPGNMPDILGAGSFALETRSSVNGRDLIETAFNWDAANSAALPFACAQTGLAEETRVSTPSGPRRLGELSTGDTVLDARGAPAHVQHVLRSPITKSAIRIRAPYFGLDQDLVLGAEQHIAVTSEAAEYLFGEETVLVPAWAVKDGRRARHWDLGKGSALLQLQLDRACALKIGNCAVGSQPKAGQSIGKILSNAEARCFATEYRHDIYS
ncbi:MAG: Hint domain-containing protein [Litoreibacter sp.]|nr:Hint domain-containing protein [Litoreibacter sp.]MCY4337096.1 Hint domain-containing protein [Litoreibacter sp.]